MEFVILTGLSGSGKSRVNSIMADLGYYCVDNMPAELFELMVELAQVRRGRFERVVLVVDVRLGTGFEPILTAIEHVKALGIEVRVLYLDARNDFIVRRYKETRRRHPLDQDYDSLEDAIEAERVKLTPLRELADLVVDTTDRSSNQLTEILAPVFGRNGAGPDMTVELRTFGFKRGLPLEADMVLDVRFLPNPYYVSELRPKTGLDAEVAAYVLDTPVCGEFLNMLYHNMAFLLPQYKAEGRQKLVVAIGCTGGRHRSVAVAERLGGYLKAGGWPCNVSHRDMEKL